MGISIVQLGTTPRKNKDELRVGTVRRPPRGVKKSDYSKLNFYDVWYPVLSPAQTTMKLGLKAEDQKSWNVFAKKFKAEMKKPDAVHALDFLAALSHKMDLSIGCYCDDENFCHRSILRELLKERGAEISK
jgi:uncharacterized protein YeaO (DUF488 family)